MTTTEARQRELPQDVDTLQAMIGQLLDSLDEQERRNRDLQHQLDWLRRQLFGRRSEKLDSKQLMLFAELLGKVEDSEQETPEPDKQASPADAATEGKKKGHGRKPLPEDMPRKRVEYHPPEAERTCPCCEVPMSVMGEELTEELEYIPASLVILEHVRIKYACRQCQENIAIGAMPARPIEKGRPGPGLLAHVLTSKYGDHLPLNRLEGIFRRQGVDISRSTMCDWVRDAAGLLDPIVQAIREVVMASYKIHTDDTPVPVLVKGRNQTRKGYLWVYVGDGGNVVFDYTPSRTRDGPLQFLQGYEGYLQADAYSGYDEIFANSEVIEVGCWAHTRRRFHEARSTDSLRCHEMLALIARLYKVERDAKERKLDLEAWRRLRQEESKPIIQEIKDCLDAWSIGVLPKSPLGQAVGYALRQWEALTRFLDDARLDLDNNLSERTLRMVAIGRKNWMFAGSDAGGERAAVIYSLIAGCKLCGIDPFAYLRDVLDRISTHPQSRIAELTPAGWKQARPSAPQS
jgi:transposase